MAGVGEPQDVGPPPDVLAFPEAGPSAARKGDREHGDRRRRWLATLLAALLVIGGLGAGAVALIHRDDDGSVRAAPVSTDAPRQSWDVPGLRDLALVDGQPWVLTGPRTQSEVGRFDMNRRTVVDAQSLTGTIDQIIGSGGYVWAWGQVFDQQLQAALDAHTKELPASGRTGIVHRISASGDVRTWQLATVPTGLVADGDAAWVSTIDYNTNRWSLARFEGSSPEVVAAPTEVKLLVDDGESLWVDGPNELVRLDRRSGAVRSTHAWAGELAGARDGRLWARAGPSRMRELDPHHLEAADNAGGYVYGAGVSTRVGDGFLMGSTTMQWLDHPRQSPEPDSEFVLPAGLHLVGQAVVQGDAVLFAAAHTQGAVTEEARLYRWVPSADRIDPASRPPLVQPPTALDLGPCAPFTPGFLTDDAGGWSESAKADPDLSGAVRQTGPGGAFIQAYPGTQPALPPTARLDATSYGATQLYLSPIPDGYLARAVLDAPKQPAPCNTLNLIGHHVTREELLQQLGSLATLVFSGPGPRGHM